MFEAEFGAVGGEGIGSGDGGGRSFGGGLARCCWLSGTVALIELVEARRYENDENESEEIDESVIDGGPERLEGGITEQPSHGVGDDELARNDGDDGPEEEKNHIPDGLGAEFGAAGLGAAGGGVSSGGMACRLVVIG